MNSNPQVLGEWERPETSTQNSSYNAHSRVSQYNAPGGSQNINPGSGNQFPGATFQAPVYFNTGEQFDPLRECLKSLAFSDMNSRSNDIDDAAKGTCEWLLRHEMYTSWASCDHDRGLLWIKGKPGSGKSTLLRHALNDGMSIPNTGEGILVLSFFFHGRGSELQKTPLGLFQSLFHQLLSQVPEALTDFVAIFRQRCETIGKSGERWQWHPRELPRFFKSSLPKVLETHSVWLFIDALDECGQKNAIKLVQEFKSLLVGLPYTGSQFRICFTCRHYPILDQSCPFEIHLEEENKQDISTYVQAQLFASPMLAASPIPSLITERAEGVFMWARLVVDKALRLDNEGQVLKRIEDAVYDIPPDLDELYLGLVRSMDKKSTSLKLIQWVCFATRPLSLDELRWAMLVDPDCPRQSLHEYQAGDYPSDHDGMKRRIQTLSCGLVEVTSPIRRRLSHRKEYVDAGRVQFTHQSAKDFFVEKGLSALNGGLSISLSTAICFISAVFLHYCPRNLLSSYASHFPTVFAVSALWQHGPFTGAVKPDIVAGIAHHRLSRICLCYLAMKEIGQTTGHAPYRLKSNFLFLHYATTSWVAHVEQSHASGVLQEDIVEYFAGPSNTLMERWVYIYQKLERLAGGRPSHGTSILHVMSSHGVAGALWALLAKGDQVGVSVDKIDSDGRTPLSWAVGEGHEAVVQLLLARGTNIEAADVRGRTPLWWAAHKGHKAIIQLLLDRGANIEAVDKNHKTPLWWAAHEGHEAIIQLLLDRGANIEAVDEYHWTPLLYAAYKGHEAIIQLLLDRGADIEAVDKNHQTPLLWAAYKGHEAIIQLLLDRGANIEAVDKNHKTPLLWAVEKGHEAVVRLLMKGMRQS